VVTFGDRILTPLPADNPLGKTPALEQIQRFSCERQVTRQTPPAFLAHAV
jgi:hypothetical protein